MKYHNIYYNIKCFHFFFKTVIRTILVDRMGIIIDFFLGTITPFLIQFLLWTAIFSNEKAFINGFTYQQTVFYYSFAIAFGRFNNGYEVIVHFSSQIREGKLESYIIKPMPYFFQRLALFLGESLVYYIPLVIIFIYYLFQVDFFNVENLFQYFWPDVFLPIMKYNPFRYMIAAPAEFIVNPSMALWYEFLFASFFYISIFFIGVRILWRKGVNKYQGAGG